MMSVLVKGAGVAGMSVAHELALRGASVTVAEISPAIAGNASWFAGGMLAPWCEAESAPPEILELGVTAAAWWERALPGVVTNTGTLVVAQARDRGELDRFSRRTTGYQTVDKNQIAVLEPDLGGRFECGLYFPQEAHLDPRLALVGLHKKLIKLGVEICFGVDGDTLTGFDWIIDCSGILARQNALRGVRGEMVILRTSDVSLSRPVRVLHPRFPVYVVPRAGGDFMVGASMIESADAGPVTARSMMELLNAGYSLHPAFGEATIVETGVGVRPAYIDNLPKVQVKGTRVSINGLYRHGFLLGPAMAVQAADRMIAFHSKTENFHEAAH